MPPTLRSEVKVRKCRPYSCERLTVGTCGGSMALPERRGIVWRS